MRITWDEPKRKANLDKHGLDFGDIESDFDFDKARLERAGPKRIKAIGKLKLNGKIVVVIFAALGTEAISIISVRPASKKERGAFGG
ncbi:MAG TPA: BrnT family toxin [Roseiarcus sp.]|nr:BrnT family toxin [Roseiarcus sp.]